MTDPIPDPAVLFTAAELGDLIGKQVTTTRAVMVERVVWGWVAPLLGLAERPSPVSDQVFSWAIELGAIAHENPAGLTRRDIGPFAEQYSAERRREILDEIAAATGSSGGLGPQRPQGCFPPPEPEIIW